MMEKWERIEIDGLLTSLREAMMDNREWLLGGYHLEWRVSRDLETENIILERN